ncbi:glycosyl hydrolase family 28 protein [Paenibacillus sp. TAF58]
MFSKRITVEGITIVDPPHYSIYLGSSEHVQIRNFKAFSTRGWSDGIDIMACFHIDIEDIFMRNSDDCIAVYGTRWDFYGDTRYVTVRNSVLWADVAHPIMMGTHGDHHKDGDTIEHIRFENIDILEHHEPQENYWGAMAINAGDLNTIRHVTFEDIRVEEFELGSWWISGSSGTRITIRFRADGSRTSPSATSPIKGPTRILTASMDIMRNEQQRISDSRISVLTES